MNLLNDKPIATAEQIREIVRTAAERPRRTQVVHVPEWGINVRLRALSRREAITYQSSNFNKEGALVPSKVRTAEQRLVALSLVDESGNPVFTEADIEALGSNDNTAIHTLATIAANLSGLNDEEAKRRVEESLGN